MENSVFKISNALLDLARASDSVLCLTPSARAALEGVTLESAERSLLQRIDGLRSIEQVLAMSGDLAGVHGVLGKLMALGNIALAPSTIANQAVGGVDLKHMPIAPSADPPAATEPDELDHAKRLLLQETKHVLGVGASKLRPRIEACRSIEQIYDLIVKVQEHLTATGKADPGVFLDRLTSGLAAARNKSSTRKRATAK
jgi:hypothetical protein